MGRCGVRCSSPDETFATYGEVVWSWRRDPGVYPSRPCGNGNGGKKGRSPGRARRKPSNHCAGKAGMSWLYLSNPCAFFLYHCTRCCGCRRRPAFPAPSVQEGATRLQDSGENRVVRMRAHVLPQIQLSSRTSEHSERRSGTHNHRIVSCEGWSSSAFHNDSLWLWVPAFAGTTAEHAAPAHAFNVSRNLTGSPVDGVTTSPCHITRLPRTNVPTG